MIPRFLRLFLPGLLLLAVVSLFAGCAEDTLGGGDTVISGRVVDPGGTGIPDVDVGVEYTTATVVTSTSFPAAAAGAVTLLPPYPNPATGLVEVDKIRIPVQVAGDTTLSVSILAPRSGVYEFEGPPLFSGRVTRDTTFLWDGHGGSGLLPNGLYLVRVTVPANPPGGITPTVMDAPILLNPPAAFMAVFNTWSDPGGAYLIGDLAVGQRFQATDSQGRSLGTQLVVELVDLVFRSQDYQPKETQVLIAPGDYVTVTTTLEPIFPAPMPVLAGAP